MTGTSAGGIIATAVSTGIPMLDCERLYDKVVRNIYMYVCVSVFVSVSVSVSVSVY